MEVSGFQLFHLQTYAVVAEWLRRWTWNPMGSTRVGSNPANCEIIFWQISNILMDKNDMSGVGFEPTQSYDYESLNLTP